jgi:hypothetical protein
MVAVVIGLVVVVGVSGAPLVKVCHARTDQIQRPCATLQTGFYGVFLGGGLVY